MRNWRQTLLSQFWDSPVLTSLIGSIEEWISPDANFEAFYDLVWNVLSRPLPNQTYGLDVWGRIVEVSRVVRVPVNTGFFGFGEAGDRTGFDQSPFYSVPVTQNYTLTDDVYRMLILTKAAYNITDGSIPAINALLMNLFPNRGNCWVTDGRNTEIGEWFGFQESHDKQPFGFGTFTDLLPPHPEPMTLTYVFTFPLLDYEVAIVEQSGAIPKPVGVEAFYQYAT